MARAFPCRNWRSRAEACKENILLCALNSALRIRPGDLSRQRGVGASGPGLLPRAPLGLCRDHRSPWRGGWGPRCSSQQRTGAVFSLTRHPQSWTRNKRLRACTWSPEFRGVGSKHYRALATPERIKLAIPAFLFTGVFMPTPTSSLACIGHVLCCLPYRHHCILSQEITLRAATWWLLPSTEQGWGKQSI